MNILLVSQPARDGVLRHVIGLTNFLLSQGDTVHLAYSDCNASDQLPGLISRIRDSGGSTLNLQVRNAPQPADVPALIRLLSLIQRIQPDVIHAHSSKAGALVRGLALLGLRKPILYSPHSYYCMNNPRGGKARIFHFLERQLGSVGITVTLSPSEANFAEDVIGIPTSRQLPTVNGVDFQTFAPSTPDRKLELRAQLGLPTDAKLLGSVGRFSPQKDPLTMYRAFAEAATALPDVHLVHLGQGELQGAVDTIIDSSGIRSRCHQIPYLRDTAPFYGALDGFLLTSLYEGMSYSVLEALASNLPLVLSRAPGNSDFANYDLSHLTWCTPGNKASIAMAITEWRRALDISSSPNHRAVSEGYFALEASLQPLREAYQSHARPQENRQFAEIRKFGIRKSQNLTGGVE